jgi:hypothetical protein
MDSAFRIGECAGDKFIGWLLNREGTGDQGEGVQLGAIAAASRAPLGAGDQGEDLKLGAIAATARRPLRSRRRSRLT